LATAATRTHNGLLRSGCWRPWVTRPSSTIHPFVHGLSNVLLPARSMSAGRQPRRSSTPTGGCRELAWTNANCASFRPGDDDGQDRRSVGPTAQRKLGFPPDEENLLRPPGSGNGIGVGLYESPDDLGGCISLDHPVAARRRAWSSRARGPIAAATDGPLAGRGSRRKSSSTATGLRGDHPLPRPTSCSSRGKVYVRGADLLGGPAATGHNGGPPTRVAASGRREGTARRELREAGTRYLADGNAVVPARPRRGTCSFADGAAGPFTAVSPGRAPPWSGGAQGSNAHGR